MQLLFNPKDCDMGDFIEIENNKFTSTTMSPIYLQDLHNNNGSIAIFTRNILKDTPESIYEHFQALGEYFEPSQIHRVT